MITILAAVASFSVILTLLASLIALAEKGLVKKGNVSILINSGAGSPLVTQTGKSLLSTLSENGLFLPSACGGGGTCGTCKCRVTEGGGDLLPIEMNHINRKMARERWRLSCQVKVRSDMKIEVPESVFSIKKIECRVEENRGIATFIKELVLRLPEGEHLDFEPGGYIQIDIPRYELEFNKALNIEGKFKAEWDRLGLFRMKSRNVEPVYRAYSMANYPAEGDIVKLNVRIATPPWDSEKKEFRNIPPGVASSFIFNLVPGDTVSVSGPYGEFFIQDTDREMVYIGGGAGMAPLRSQIFHLFRTLKTKRKVSFWYGARSVREIFYEEEFRELEKKFKNFTCHIALSAPQPEDNWNGPTGFIHKVVYEKYLEKHPAPEDVEYYLCGPPMMLDAVTKMLDCLGVEQEMIRFDNFG